MAVQSALIRSAPPWTADVYAKIGALLVELALNPDDWMHRRVERIEFIDDVRVRRHLSIDFTIPIWPVYSSVITHLPPGFVVVPIARFRKGFWLRDFDLRDEAGSALPLLTKWQNQAIGASIMLYCISAIAGEMPSQNILRDLVELVHDDSPGHAESRGLDLIATYAASNDPVLQALAANELFHWAVKVLARQYILCTLLKAAPGERRIVKFAYEDAVSGGFSGSITQPLSLVSYLAVIAGWRSTEVKLPIVIGEWEGSHVECVAPDELFFERAELIESGTRRLQGHDGPSGLIHLQAGRSRAGNYTLHLRFRMLASGMVSAAMLLALLTGALLAGGLAFHWIWHLHPIGEAPAALLLAVPGTVAAFIFGPGHHQLFQRLFGGLRIVGLGLTFVSFGAAALLAIPPLPGGRLREWAALTAISLGGFLVTLVAFRRSASGRRIV